MAQSPSLKRKQPVSAVSAAAPKRAKVSNARTILTQTSDKALSKHGDLDVAAFVKAREYEIKALEVSMGNSKKALSTRAFQQMPRNLRRRTASHNVKKVPKRLRLRAAKEVSLDTVVPGSIAAGAPIQRVKRAMGFFRGMLMVRHG